METIVNAFGLLFKSFYTNDILISIIALITGILYVHIWLFKGKLKKELAKEPANIEVISSRYKVTAMIDSIFLTLVSLFPLFGMFGTVAGLLGLDLSTGDMENIKVNFFVALTSTAWGIIWSIIFKILNAVVANDVDNQLENAKKFLEKNKRV